MNTAHLLELVPLLVALVGAAAMDLRTRRIPNWLTLGLMVSGLGRGLALGGLAGLGHSLCGMLAGAAIPLALFAINALGGADVKLMAAIGAWLGAGPAFLIFMVTALVGLVIVLVQSLAQHRTGVLFHNSAVIVLSALHIPQLGLKTVMENGQSCRSVRRPLPYAVPVLLATVLVIGIACW